MLFLAMVMAFLGACGSSDSGEKDEEAVSGKDGKSAEDTLKEKLRDGSTLDTSLSFAEAHDGFTMMILPFRTRRRACLTWSLIPRRWVTWRLMCPAIPATAGSIP